MNRVKVQAALTWRPVLALTILAFSTFVSLSTYWRVVRAGGNDHQTGDWLINYSAGFIRRGFIGEILRFAYPDDLLVATAILQMTLWLLFVAFVVYRLRKDEWSSTSILLWCGPAAVPFAGWDPQGGLRKEIIAFLALAVMSLAADRVGRARMLLVSASCVIWAVSLLSWEATVVLLPTLLILCRRAFGDDRKQWRIAGTSILVVSAAAVGASLAAPGGTRAAAGICDDLLSRGFDKQICDGSIRWLGYDLQYGYDYTIGFMPQNLYFVPLAALALLPVCWLGRFCERRWWWPAQIAVILSLSLIAADYGRWIHMAAIATAFLALGRTEGRSEPPAGLVVVYLLGWGVQHALFGTATTPVWRGGWMTFVQHYLP
ncbi:hypothetical protein nbrc107696_17110 [Gordonia spumicola]|uniref:Uncharacterized protein n=1 Tax=Gordonia spumicola TaxID=589161 RepID=A0A7I9V7A4_9ACTN|nr:hypothetical protein [Gordonia spumicola]GEE01265.1 hypothetical protein nbrc107696_17110 [Gordonia spumicola]